MISPGFPPFLKSGNLPSPVGMTTPPVGGAETLPAPVQECFPDVWNADVHRRKADLELEATDTYKHDLPPSVSEAGTVSQGSHRVNNTIKSIAYYALVDRSHRWVQGVSRGQPVNQTCEHFIQSLASNR